MKSIGIDLGTTNSVGAFCELGQRNPRVLANSAGENLTPSVLSLKRKKGAPQEGQMLIGRSAVNNAIFAPEDTVFSIKRLMGRTFNDEKVALVRQRFNYRVVPAQGENPGVCVPLGNQKLTPVEISAEILKQIKADASKALGAEVTHAVITVPAYFKERQRAATRQAGTAAGFVVKKIIDEPTAAAIAFGVQCPPGGRHRILVYDLGGGTFDISILQFVQDREGRDQFQVLEIQGDDWLGGDDFDRKIVERIIETIQNERKFDPVANLDDPSTKKFLLLAKQAAERAKIALGASIESDIILPAALKHEGEFIDVELTLSRADFEGMIRSYVDASMELVRKALKAQELETDDISDVLMVGGSTLVPLVFQTVQEFFGSNKVRRGVNPMDCVALGASVLASTFKGVECPNSACKAENEEAAEKCVKCGGSLSNARAVSGTSINEVTPMHLGIRAVKGSHGDAFAIIIPKGTVYPLTEPKKQMFRATGRSIRVPVYEGMNDAASRNEEQGVVQFELPADAKPDAEVEVAFNYDRNRELTVTVRVQGTTIQTTETLRRDLPRTPPPPLAVEEPEQNWESELDETVSFARQFLTDYGPYMDSAQRAKIEANVARAGQANSFREEEEARKVVKVLQNDVFESGVATQLFLAVNAMDGVAPDLTEKINKAVNEIKRAHDAGERARVTQVVGALRPLIAQALARKTGVAEIADQQDFGGLLRLLRD